VPRCPNDDGRDRDTVCVFPIDHLGQHSWWKEWVPSTWTDVRPGDGVRLGTTEAFVKSIVPDPERTGIVHAVLTGRAPMAFRRISGVEILVDHQRAAIQVLVDAFGDVTELGSSE
jgi:hypothetical protein